MEAASILVRNNKPLIKVATASEDRGRERSTEAMEGVSAIGVVHARLPEEAAAVDGEVTGAPLRAGGLRRDSAAAVARGLGEELVQVRRERDATR